MSEQITTFCGENIKNENLEVITDNLILILKSIKF